VILGSIRGAFGTRGNTPNIRSHINTQRRRGVGTARKRGGRPAHCVRQETVCYNVPVLLTSKINIAFDDTARAQPLYLMMFPHQRRFRGTRSVRAAQREWIRWGRHQDPHYDGDTRHKPPAKAIRDAGHIVSEPGYASCPPHALVPAVRGNTICRDRRTLPRLSRSSAAMSRTSYADWKRICRYYGSNPQFILFRHDRETQRGELAGMSRAPQ